MSRPFGAVTLALFTALVISAAPAKQAVSIKGMKFNPASIDVKVGETVKWDNDDDRDHTVTATDASFSSGNLRGGESFEHKFTKAGKFAYGCSYHPRMKGTVNVAE